MLHLAPAHVVLFQKAWQALSGFVTALLVTQFLSAGEQGYYYAIGSLLSCYVLLDLGLSGLLVQLSARMFSGLDLGDEGRLGPVGDRRSAFLAMLAWSRRWYARTSFLVLLLIPLGFIYFSFARTSHEEINWQWPWIFVVIAVALSMPAYSALSIVEGAGRVAEVYWVRFAHYSLGAVLAWTLIAGGNGLYAPAMPALAIAVTTTVWFRLRYRGLLEEGETSHGFLWRQEVWPLQKRVALSWFAGYAFLNAPILIVFYYRDAASAGQFGLTAVIANVLGSLCASWLTAAVPRMTNLVSFGQDGDSKALFRSEFKKAMFLMVLSYGAVVLLIMGIGHLSVAQRLLPPLETTLLFAVFTIFHSVGMLSLHFRARGREVLAYPLAVAILLSLIMSCVIAPNLGVVGVIVVFFGLFVLICIPAMIIGWRRMHGGLVPEGQVPS
jgi:hypothetical protein